MTSRLGLAAPLLPVTGAALVPFGIYFVFSNVRIAYHRLSTGDTFGSQSKTQNRILEDPEDQLYTSIRAFGNYAENVPFALLLSGVAELNGAPRKALAWTMGAYFAFRVLHAEFGIMIHAAHGWGRPVGYYGALTVLSGLAVWNGLLTMDWWLS